MRSNNTIIEKIDLTELSDGAEDDIQTSNYNSNNISPLQKNIKEMVPDPILLSISHFLFLVRT
jgi:hypothetical protein